MIYKEGGIRGLYKGGSATVVRAALLTGECSIVLVPCVSWFCSPVSIHGYIFSVVSSFPLDHVDDSCTNDAVLMYE